MPVPGPILQASINPLIASMTQVANDFNALKGIMRAPTSQNAWDNEHGPKCRELLTLFSTLTKDAKRAEEFVLQESLTAEGQPLLKNLNRERTSMQEAAAKALGAILEAQCKTSGGIQDCHLVETTQASESFLEKNQFSLICGGLGGLTIASFMFDVPAFLFNSFSCFPSFRTADSSRIIPTLSFLALCGYPIYHHRKDLAKIPKLIQEKTYKGILSIAQRISSHFRPVMGIAAFLGSADYAMQKWSSASCKSQETNTPPPTPPTDTATASPSAQASTPPTDTATASPSAQASTPPNSSGAPQRVLVPSQDASLRVKTACSDPSWSWTTLQYLVGGIALFALAQSAEHFFKKEVQPSFKMTLSAVPVPLYPAVAANQQPAAANPPAANAAAGNNAAANQQPAAANPPAANAANQQPAGANAARNARRRHNRAAAAAAAGNNPAANQQPIVVPAVINPPQPPAAGNNPAANPQPIVVPAVINPQPPAAARWWHRWF